MSFEEALLERLRTHVGLAALIGAGAAMRAAWVDRPQLDALPAVSLEIVSWRREQTMKDFDQTQRPWVKLIAWGSTYGEARAVADAVEAAIVPAATIAGIRFQRAFLSRRTGGEPGSTGLVHRHILDTRFTFSNAA